MSSGALFLAAGALALERAAYLAISRAPDRFAALCARPPLHRLGGPVRAVEALFWSFKALQVAVFATWISAHGGVPPRTPATGPALIVGGGLLLLGQILNASVFLRLGRVGVFYGDRFGHAVPWCRDFPFSVLAHPQYVGAALSIWGLFVATRWPAADWYLLPALETVYYAVGAWMEAPAQPRQPEQRKRHEVRGDAER